MKFRKKPIVVEAEQWFPEKDIEGVNVLKKYLLNGTLIDNEWTFVNTLEGLMHVSPGDWIITGVDGEKYPCKPDIFEKTYEPVEE